MIILTETDSTNSYVKREHLRLPDGEAVLALSQTSGRGRLGRTWLSEGRNLCLTVFLKSQPSLLPFRAALAGEAALRQYIPVRFKWPNDLLVRDGESWKKLSGILCEGFDGCSAVGIGINLEFPHGAPVPHAACLGMFCVPPAPETLGEEYRQCLLNLLTLTDREVLERYRPLCETVGHIVTLPDGSSGRAIDLEEDGRLTVETDAGRFSVGSGEVCVQDIY